jgi:hypothetical protein
MGKSSTPNLHMLKAPLRSAFIKLSYLKSLNKPRLTRLPSKSSVESWVLFKFKFLMANISLLILDVLEV